MHRAILCAFLLSSGVAAGGPEYKRYPNARNLCSEHISGNASGKPMHITWATYATKDPVAKVVAFYEKATGEKHDPGDKDERMWSDGDRRLVVYPASQNEAFPSCATKPVRGENTVIQISSAAR